MIKIFKKIETNWFIKFLNDLYWCLFTYFDIKISSFSLIFFIIEGQSYNKKINSLPEILENRYLLILHNDSMNNILK